MVAHLTANQQSWVRILLLPSTRQFCYSLGGLLPRMAQYGVLAPEEIRARGMRHVWLYIVTRVHVHIAMIEVMKDTSCI